MRNLRVVVIVLREWYMYEYVYVYAAVRTSYVTVQLGAPVRVRRDGCGHKKRPQEERGPVRVQRVPRTSRVSMMW